MSGFISDSVVSEMRALEESGMTFVCVVRNAQASTSGPTGGKVRGAATVHADVPCGLKPLKGSERETGEGSNAYADYEIRMPLEVGGEPNAVASKHQVLVAAKDPQPAMTFEVVTVHRGQTAISCQAVLKN